MCEQCPTSPLARMTLPLASHTSIDLARDGIEPNKAAQLWDVTIPQYRGMLDGIRGWVYDPISMVYRKGRQVVDQQKTKALLRLFVNKIQQQLETLSNRPLPHTNTARYIDKLADYAHDAHVAGGALAAGGTDKLTPRLQRVIMGATSGKGVTGKRSLAYTGSRLAAFGDDLADGRYEDNPDAITQRAKLYAMGAHRAFDAVRQLGMLGTVDAGGPTHQRNILGDAEQHCGECLALTADDWVPIGTQPMPGDRECSLGCTCGFEYGSPTSADLDRNANDGVVGHSVSSPLACSAVQDTDMQLSTFPVRSTALRAIMLDSGGDIEDWITINHQHIPIHKGETKEDVAKHFVEHQKAKEASSSVSQRQHKESTGKRAKDVQKHHAERVAERARQHREAEHAEQQRKTATARTEHEKTREKQVASAAEKERHTFKSQTARALPKTLRKAYESLHESIKPKSTHDVAEEAEHEEHEVHHNPLAAAGEASDPFIEQEGSGEAVETAVHHIASRIVTGEALAEIAHKGAEALHESGEATHEALGDVVGAHVGAATEQAGDVAKEAAEKAEHIASIAGASWTAANIAYEAVMQRSETARNLRNAVAAKLSTASAKVLAHLPTPLRSTVIGTMAAMQVGRNILKIPHTVATKAALNYAIAQGATSAEASKLAGHLASIDLKINKWAGFGVEVGAAVSGNPLFGKLAKRAVTVVPYATSAFLLKGLAQHPVTMTGVAVTMAQHGIKHARRSAFITGAHAKIAAGAAARAGLGALKSASAMLLSNEPTHPTLPETPDDIIHTLVAAEMAHGYSTDFNAVLAVFIDHGLDAGLLPTQCIDAAVEAYDNMTPAQLAALNA